MKIEPGGHYLTTRGPHRGEVVRVVKLMTNNVLYQRTPHARTHRGSETKRWRKVRLAEFISRHERVGRS